MKTVIVALVTAAVVFGGSGNTTSTRFVHGVSALLSDDSEVRADAQRQLLAERKELIAALVDIVRSPTNRARKLDSVARAMFLLGEMRAAEAVEVLAENIGFGEVPTRDPATGALVHLGALPRGVPVEQRLPAVGALVKIGEPAVGPAVRKLASGEHIAEEEGCVIVLARLKGKLAAVEIVKKAIERESDERRRQRLEHGLRRLDALPEAAATRPSR